MKLHGLMPAEPSPLASVERQTFLPRLTVAERNPAEAENLRIHSPTPRRGSFLRRRMKA